MGTDRFEKENSDTVTQLPGDLAPRLMTRQQRDFDWRTYLGHQFGAFDHAAG